MSLFGSSRKSSQPRPSTLMITEKEQEIEALNELLQAQKAQLVEKDLIIKQLQDQVRQLQVEQDLCIKCKSNMKEEQLGGRSWPKKAESQRYAETYGKPDEEVPDPHPVESIQTLRKLPQTSILQNSRRMKLPEPAKPVAAQTRAQLLATGPVPLHGDQGINCENTDIGDLGNEAATPQLRVGQHFSLISNKNVRKSEMLTRGSRRSNHNLDLKYYLQEEEDFIEASENVPHTMQKSASLHNTLKKSKFPNNSPRRQNGDKKPMFQHLKTNGLQPGDANQHFSSQPAAQAIQHVNQKRAHQQILFHPNPSMDDVRNSNFQLSPQNDFYYKKSNTIAGKAEQLNEPKLESEESARNLIVYDVGSMSKRNTFTESREPGPG